MSRGKLPESLPEDDRTILSSHTSLPQAPQSFVSEKSDAPSSSKASLVAQQKLDDLFPPYSAAPKTKYTDDSLQKIANLLRLSDRERWSAVPRIYTVLRNIGQLQLIEEFIDEGFTDIWFPFTAQNLPPRLSPSIKAQFLSTQSVVFTQALDLEKREGRHAAFAADDPLWFEIKGRLGRGAFGVVDKVVSLITLQEYARKRMRRGNNFTKSKKEIKEFKAELAILKTVNHHHCVKLVGSYTDPEYLGLIMDPVADCDLSTFLTEALTNTDKKSLLRGYFGCLASALRYLHERQIRHRDIKPPNILVKGDTVYLADFGIALDWSEMTRGTTTVDTAKSPIYCAPEVARSEPRGSSADIWSLGCVFAEMVSVLKGSSIEDMRSYFKKTSGSYMFHHNIETSGQWLSDLKCASAVDNPPIEWCLKMLVSDRNERYTADQLMEVIRLESEPDPSKFINQSFCGDCCMDQDHILSDGNNTGEDPWADSEDEDTPRLHDVLVSGAILEQGQVLPGALKLREEGHASTSAAVIEPVPLIDLEQMQPLNTKSQYYLDLTSKDKIHTPNLASQIHQTYERELRQSIQGETETSQALNDISRPNIASELKAALVKRANESSTDTAPDSLIKRLPPQTVGSDPLALQEEIDLTALSSDDQFSRLGSEARSFPSFEGERQGPSATIDKLGLHKPPISNEKGGPGIKLATDPTFVKFTSSRRSSRSSRSIRSIRSSRSIRSIRSSRSIPSIRSSPSIRSTRFSRPIPSIRSSRSIPSIRSSRSIPSIRSSRSIPSIRSSRSIPSIRSSPSIRSIRSSRPIPSIRSSPSIPSTRISRPIPSIRSSSSIPSTRFSRPIPSIRSSRSIRSWNTLPLSPNITITIILADNLIKRDIFGYPDPFAILELSGEQRMVTSVVKKTLKPFWNESFDLRVAKESILEVHLYDQKKYNSKKRKKREKSFLGLIEVRMEDIINFPPDRGHMLNLNLMQRDNSHVLKGKLIMNLAPVAKKSSERLNSPQDLEEEKRRTHKIWVKSNLRTNWPRQ